METHSCESRLSTAVHEGLMSQVEQMATSPVEHDLKLWGSTSASNSRSVFWMLWVVGWPHSMGSP